MKNRQPSYIAYLDLLGTKGFCEETDVYYDNIKKFSNTVESLAPSLGEDGKIGIFSDCVYIECSKLEKILYFLSELRGMLIGDGLFFNAALSKGKLGVESMSDDKESNIYGVRFTNKEISSIYCKQTNFRGIGIWIDDKLLEDVKSKTNYNPVRSFFYAKKIKGNSTIFEPVNYYDIPLFDQEDKADFYYEVKKKNVFSIIIKALYTAHCKSLKYSAYYVSLLVNIIRCCDVSGLTWNKQQQVFENTTKEFDIIFSFLKKCDKTMPDLVGIDGLCLSFLNSIYNASQILDFDRARITEYFIETFNCLSTRYSHSLVSVPEEPFTGENRKSFLAFCNQDMARKFVDNIIENK